MKKHSRLKPDGVVSVLGLIYAPWLPWMAVAFLIPVTMLQAAGRYTLAFWREAGAYENQAPPAGQFGNHSAFVHAWDENGQPLANKQIYTSWGVLLGTTDANGFVEIELRRPNGYDFRVRDGAHASDTTPVLSVERAPNWGHYSFEIGFVFKPNTAILPRFDTNYLGVINASGPDPCLDLSAPYTRSLAYYSTSTNYCSDSFSLGTWTDSHSQTFVATGNRVMALKAFMAAGFGAHFYYTAQILEGSPNGLPLGPPRSTRLMVDGEYYPILLTWGLNDVQVVPGRTYCFKITRTEGVNVYRVNRDNYPLGQYYQSSTPVAGVDLMGLVVCGTVTNAGGGILAGFVRDTNGLPLGGSLVAVQGAGLYSTAASDGAYSIDSVPPGNYDVSVARTGFITALQTNVTIIAGQTNRLNFVLRPGGQGGAVTNTSLVTQPFEILPVWDSAFDASWGSGATFSLVTPGQTGNALQVSRGGPGSSARVQVFTLEPNTPYRISVWMRCPAFSSAYWAECAYKFGINTAQNFDSSSSTWSLLKKFSDTGVNGNSSTWTEYSAQVNSGANTKVSIGFKLGASAGTGPIVQFDQLDLVPLTLPAVQAALAETNGSVRIVFREPVNPVTATNPANYTLTSVISNATATSGAMLSTNTVQLMVLNPLLPRTDYTLTVSNVTTVRQPVSLRGRNDQLAVRVPWTLVALDANTLWKFDQSGTDLGTVWRATNYDDSAWLAGPGLLGASGDILPEPIRTPLAPGIGKPTFYFRQWFHLPAVASNATLRVRALVDDGAMFWFNNQPLLRLGLANDTPVFGQYAARAVETAAWEEFYLAPAVGCLVPGDNLLAVEVHQADALSPDLVFGAILETLVLPTQIPTARVPVAITRGDQLVTLTWAEPLFTLETATNLAGPWTPNWNVQSPLTTATTNTHQFFRLRY